MISSVHKAGRTAARAIAMFIAALLIVSQVVGVAHFHEGAVSRDGAASAQLGADPGFCPVCQLALHSPGSVSATVTIARGAVIAEKIYFPAPIRAESPIFSTARVRAPPTAL